MPTAEYPTLVGLTVKPTLYFVFIIFLSFVIWNFTFLIYQIKYS